MYAAYKSRAWMQFFESLGYYNDAGYWSSTARHEMVARLMEEDVISLDEAYELVGEDSGHEIQPWEYRSVQEDRDRTYGELAKVRLRLSEEMDRAAKVTLAMVAMEKSVEEIKDKVRTVGHDQFCRYRPSDPDDSACDCLRREVLALFPTVPKDDTLADSSAEPKKPKASQIAAAQLQRAIHLRRGEPVPPEVEALANTVVTW